MKKNISFYSTIFGLAFLVSCGGDTNSETSNDTDQAADVEVMEVTETVEFLLPSTVQIGDLFRNSGLEYVSGLTLDPARASNYNTTYDKYFAFGVYWTDMTYCVLNQQSQEARKYMEVIKNLSGDLGADEVYNDEIMLDRFERNLDNNDSILDILIEIDERTDDYVEDNDQQELALIAFVAGWTEGMYLGVSTSHMETQTLVTGRIIEQMVIMDNLIKGLKKYQGSSKKVDEVIVKMEEMYAFYIGIPAIAHVEGSIMDVKIPTNDLKILGDKIVGLRKLIVE